jgi:hypothetical protein
MVSSTRVASGEFNDFAGRVFAIAQTPAALRLAPHLVSSRPFRKLEE